MSLFQHRDHLLIVSIDEDNFERACQLAPLCDQSVREEALSTMMARRDEMPQEKSIALLRALCSNNGAKITSASIRRGVENNHLHLLDTLIDTAVEQWGVKGAAALILDQAPGTWRGSLPAKPSSFDLVVEKGSFQAMERMFSVLVRAKLSIPSENPYIITLVGMDREPSKTQDRIKCIELLIENGWDINQVDKSGDMPIHYASSVEMLDFLVEQGADIRAKGQRGNRPLYNLWLRRNTQFAYNSGINLIERDVLACAQRMIEHGALWKDAPTVDIMKLQISNHPLSEFLINGRRRAELSVHASGRVAATGQAVESGADRPRARPMM